MCYFGLLYVTGLAWFAVVSVVSLSHTGTCIWYIHLNRHGVVCDYTNWRCMLTKFKWHDLFSVTQVLNPLHKQRTGAA